MTPPSAKQKSISIQESGSDATETETETETVKNTDTDQADAPVSAKGAGPRQRAASLGLRVAGRRSVSTEETGGAGSSQDRGPRNIRAVAPSGMRQGPRARQRAAKAALAENQSLKESQSFKDDRDHDQADLDQATDRDLSEYDSVVAVGGPTEGAAPGLDPRAQVALAPLPAKPVVNRPADLPPAEVLPDDDGFEDDRNPGGGRRRRLGPKAEKRAARAINSNDAAHYVVAPTVNMAQMRPRHYGVIALFVLMVVMPTLSYSWYLWTKSADQYESNVGFGSRTEDAPSTFDFLGALGGVSQSGSKDMDILNQFIISQELVAKLDKQLDLKAIFSKAKDDPLNSFNKDGTIEDLLAYWQRMVIVNYDSSTGLMTLQVFAFDPQDAKKIAQSILVESTAIINDLSLTAQVDTTRYSKDALSSAEQKLGDVRIAVLDFQIKNHIVDPSNVIASQITVIGTLNQQLATAQIDLDMLTGTVGEKDLRIASLNRRVEVIQNRIAEEQSKVGGTDSSAPGFAKLMQDFERLKVDQDFAEKAYLAALAAYDQAINDAQHKTRYLATYVAPTMAEASTAPNRPFSALIVALIGFLLWSVIVLIYYALRDRR